MNEKIGLQDLVVLLAEKANISKKDAETLVKECFDTMEEGLLNDKLLKIRNLGTFKLVRVEDRESVDVSTGERVLIPAHYKVTFSPDVELAETVNAPYASLEANEIEEDELPEKTDDDTGIDDDADDEAEDDNEERLPEAVYSWKEAPEQEAPEIEITEDEPEESETVEIEPEEPEFEEPEFKREEIRTVYERQPVYRDIKTEPEEAEEAEPEEPEPEEEPAYSEQYDEEYRPIEATNGLFWLFFLIAAVLIIFFAGRYFCPMINYGAGRAVVPDSVVVFSYSVHKPQVSDSLKAETQKSDSVVLRTADVPKTQASATPAKQTPKAPAPAPAPSKTGPVAAPKAPAVAKPAAAPKVQTAANQPAKTFVDKKYKVRRGERLNKIALREYGHKAFWVYIYDENRKAIRNPDLIEPGMVINIPPAAKYGINKNSRESVNKALELERKYKP